MPTANNIGVELSGSISEARAIYEEGGSTIDQILLAVSFEVGGVKWNNGTWVQTYLQWEDPQNPGTYMGMTCNAKYDSPTSDRNYSN